MMNFCTFYNIFKDITLFGVKREDPELDLDPKLMISDPDAGDKITMDLGGSGTLSVSPCLTYSILCTMFLKDEV